MIVVCITKKAITAEITATSFAFFAIPKATAAAKIIGKLLKNAFPTLVKIVKKLFKNVPFPKIASKCNDEIVVLLVNELPIPKNKPATGNTAIGNIKLRPILCKTLKIFAFMLPSNTIIFP